LGAPSGQYRGRSLRAGTSAFLFRQATRLMVDVPPVAPSASSGTTSSASPWTTSSRTATVAPTPPPSGACRGEGEWRSRARRCWRTRCHPVACTP